MRLLEYRDGDLHITEDLHDHEIPPYAILSHTWGQRKDEVNFRDMLEGTGRNKTGYEKITFCSEQTVRDNLQYFWIDSCCIDRSSSAELSEAITSMFRWYQRATKCYVYLADVSTTNPYSRWNWEQAFRASRWFTRGWTLQELLAPSVVEFFSYEGRLLGDKNSLEDLVNDVTGIALGALQGLPMSQFEIDERLSWAKFRHTTRGEDEAYCLLGIFEISMPIIYGEGRERAIDRLRKEINESSKRTTWEMPQAGSSHESTPSMTKGKMSQIDVRGWKCHVCASEVNSGFWGTTCPDCRHMQCSKCASTQQRPIVTQHTEPPSMAGSSNELASWVPKYKRNWGVMRSINGHEGPAYAVAFSPDGKMLASGSSDGTIKLWDSESWTVLRTLEDHERYVRTVAFSPDGKILASESEDDTIKLWDSESWTVLRTLEDHESYVRTVAFSPDGKILASGSDDDTIKLWDSESWTVLRRLEGHKSWVQTVAFSPDGKMLASGSLDCTIKLWDSRSWTVLQTLEDHEKCVKTVAFSPDGKMLASGDDDCTIKLWDSESWTVLRTLEGHKSWVETVAFSPDGKMLASGSIDRTIKLWDSWSGDALQTLKDHERPVRALALSPDGKMLASGDEGGIVKLWG